MNKRLIKTYESFNLDKLELGWLEERIDKDNIIQNSDGTFDYVDDLNLDDQGLNSFTDIPIQFRKVHGNLNCEWNALKNLEGSPRFVDGAFYFGNNQMFTLRGCPEKIKGNFKCDMNQLISLQYAPLEIGGIFDCTDNNLLSKKHTSYVNGDFVFLKKNPFSITDKVISSIKRMSYQEQMAELKFFDTYDVDASRMFQEALDSLGIEYGTHRKEMRDFAKGKDVGYLGL